LFPGKLPELPESSCIGDEQRLDGIDRRQDIWEQLFFSAATLDRQLGKRARPHIATDDSSLCRYTSLALNNVPNLPPETFADFDEGGIILTGIDSMPNPGW
jgi:hypothetical protein